MAKTGNGSPGKSGTTEDRRSAGDRRKGDRRTINLAADGLLQGSRQGDRRVQSRRQAGSEPPGDAG